VKVIADYDYIYNVIDYDYDYIASGNGDYDYDYWISCNRLQSITDYDYPKTLYPQSGHDYLTDD